MVRNLAILIIALAGFASPQETHKFWDTQQIIGQSLNAGIHVADAVVTCQHSGQLGFHELTAPSQTCGGIAAWTMLAVPASIGTSALLHRTGHHRLERYAPYIYAGAGGFGFGFTFTH
jgi:hypothetical protein